MEDKDDSLTRAGRALYWPRLLRDHDLAQIFGLSQAEALEALLKGEFGPYFEIGGRPAILKDSLLIHLGKLEREQAEQSSPLLSILKDRDTDGGDE